MNREISGEEWQEPFTMQVNKPIKENEVLKCNYCGNHSRFTVTTLTTWIVDAYGKNAMKFSEEVWYWCQQCRNEVKPQRKPEENLREGGQE